MIKQLPIIIFCLVESISAFCQEYRTFREYCLDDHENMEIKRTVRIIKEEYGVEDCNQAYIEITKYKDMWIGSLFEEISDLSPIAQFTHLESLELGGHKISNLAPLSKLTNLKTIDLIGNNISDMSPIAELKMLEKLNIRGNNLTNLFPLAVLTNLVELDIGSNKIFDLKPLIQLSKLADLDISQSPIEEIYPLASLTKLRYLYIGNTGINEEQISWLKNQLPKTIILRLSKIQSENQGRIRMGGIAQSLELFRIHNKRYPNTNEGLNALINMPESVQETWRGPYIEKQMLIDPWGTNYDYALLNLGNDYKIKSAGRDKQFGTKEDLSYPL